MYLGTIYISPKFRPDRTSNMAAIPILENQLSAITPTNGCMDHLQNLIIVTSSEDTLLNTWVFI
jgi:hypothetical protein